MKRVLVIVLALVLVFALVGCGEKKEATTPEETSGDDFVVDVPDDRVQEEEVYFPEEELGVYDVVRVISLDENPTTGYSWSFKFDDDTIAVVEGDEYTQNENAEGLVGVGGVHAYRISGLKEGNTTLTFRYMHSWEDETSAIKTITYDISVDAENKIAVTGLTHSTNNNL